MTLTPKQEAFVLKYLECSNASESYRHAYNTGNMKEETIHRKAKEVIDNGKVAARLQELKQEIQAPIVEQLKIDRKFITEEALNAIEVAKEKKDSAVVLKGLEMLNKMYDLNEEKHNDRLISAKDRQALVENVRKRLIDVTPGEK